MSINENNLFKKNIIVSDDNNNIIDKKNKYINTLFNYVNIFKFSKSTIFKNVDNNLFKFFLLNINNFIKNINQKIDLNNHSLWNNESDEKTVNFIYDLTMTDSSGIIVSSNMTPSAVPDIYKKEKIDNIFLLFYVFLIKYLLVNMSGCLSLFKNNKNHLKYIFKLMDDASE